MRTKTNIIIIEKDSCKSSLLIFSNMIKYVVFFKDNLT